MEKAVKNERKYYKTTQKDFNLHIQVFMNETRLEIMGTTGKPVFFYNPFEF
jgi:hypothetical protein